MAEETDGLGEALDEHVRVAVTAAAQIGQQLAQARRDQARREAEQSQAHAQALSERMEAQRRVAGLDYAHVEGEDWWERARPEAIGRAYTSAHAWAQEDPAAARAVQRIDEQLRERYDIDTAATGADPAAVREAVDRAQAERATGEQEAGQAANLAVAADQQEQRSDTASTPAETEDADELADRYSEDNAVAYDSAERRLGTAAAMEAAGFDAQAIDAHMIADLGRAQPITEATRGAASGAAPRARSNRGRSLNRPADLGR